MSLDGTDNQQQPGLGRRGPQGGRQAMQLETKKYIVFDTFETMDTEPARFALSPKRLAWCENLLILSANFLAAVPGPGAVLATLTGETITTWYDAFINGADYIIAFCASGAGYGVNLASGAKTKFANAGTFSASPDMTQWQDQRILIGDTQAGYCTWDGATSNLFIQQGNVSPNLILTLGGEGYGSAPTVAISGGTGSGATATATVTNGAVTALTLTNPGSGYVDGDVLLLKFSGGTPTAGGILSVTVIAGGFNYFTAPNVTFAAPVGGGTTATGTAVIAGGQVTGINITVAGTGYKETPAITISAVDAGTGAVATPNMATVASGTVVIWPFTIKPSTLAIFQGRVFLGLGRQLSYTGTAGYDDVDIGNAAGTTILQDADLVHSITALRALNNYLFIFGDQSIKQVGSLSVTGSITNFTITTLTSDQGTTFKDSCVSFNRLTMMTNLIGTYQVYGASVEQISNPMTTIFRNFDATITPVSAVLDLYGHHLLLTLIRYKDPVKGNRTLLMTYFDKKYQVLSQGDGLINIVTARLLTGEKLYGTSGSDITQLTSDATGSVAVILQSALSHNKEPVMGKRAIRVGSGQSATVTNNLNVTIDSESNSFTYAFSVSAPIIWVNNSNQVITWLNNSAAVITFSVGGFVYDTNIGGASGIYLGFTLTGSFQNFSFNNYAIEYQDAALFGSRNTS